MEIHEEPSPYPLPKGEGKRAVIFANGEIKDYEAMRKVLKTDDTLIAADGGLRHLTALGLKPDLLIGDLDSVTEEDVRRMESLGVEIRRYPVEKNETDLELALMAAAKVGYATLLIAGGLGGRLDQTLGNLFLLRLPEIAGRDVRLDDGHEEVFLINQEGLIEGKAGEIVSLIPFGGAAMGVKTEGLYYPLHGETLVEERTRGISNEMLGERAKVSIEGGRVLCVHTRG